MYINVESDWDVDPLLAHFVDMLEPPLKPVFGQNMASNMVKQCPPREGCQLLLFPAGRFCQTIGNICAREYVR